MDTRVSALTRQSAVVPQCAVNFGSLASAAMESSVFNISGASLKSTARRFSLR